jgi:hypothetical protein
LEENLKGAPWDVRTYTKKKAMQDGEQAQNLFYLNKWSWFN